MSADLPAAGLASTIDIYKQLLSDRGRTSNIVVSPFSIAAAFYMTLAGARHLTADEIADAPHVKKDSTHKRFSKLLAKVSSFAPDVTLEFANRLYAEETFIIPDKYVAVLKEFYNSPVAPVNFKSEAEAARLAINAWVEEATKTKIKDLLPSGAVDSGMALVLVNAIYFKGLWKEQFNPRATSMRKFYVSKKEPKEVQMMYKQSHFNINTECSDLNANAIEIPYKGGKTSLVILLPREIDGLPELEADLTPSKFSDVLAGLALKLVDLSLPRFKIEHSVNVKSVLDKMAVRELFTNAELLGIGVMERLVVSAALHKAFVEVNEEGTEAAAATGDVGIPLSLRIPTPFAFAVDHPFMFFIRSHDPDVMLFAGSVRDI